MAEYLFKQTKVTGATETEIIDQIAIGSAITSITVGGHDTITIDATLVDDGETDLIEYMESLGYEYQVENPYDRNTTLFEAFVPLASVTDASFPFMGDFQSIATGLITDFLTTASMREHHLYLYVISIVTGGDIVITGTSINEFTGVPTASDTETISVDTTGGQYYKTDKKWLEIDSLVLVGVVGIVYDFGTINYYEGFGSDFRILGYRMDIRSQGTSSDLRFRMRKIKNLSGNKFEFETIEDIGYDSTTTNGEIVDNLRTGPSDRSYTMSTQLMPNNRQLTLEQKDLPFYHATSGSSTILGSEHEGVLIDFLGQGDGGISNVDNVLINIILQN